MLWHVKSIWQEPNHMVCTAGTRCWAEQAKAGPAKGCACAQSMQAY